MAAVKLMVMYPPPKDVPTFERLYQDEHVPMAVRKLAGKTKLVATMRHSSRITFGRRRWAPRGTGTWCPGPSAGPSRNTGTARFRRAFTQQGTGRAADWASVTAATGHP